MKKYQKIIILAILIFFAFGFLNIRAARAITLEEIKIQLAIILEKIAEIQKQLNELIEQQTAQTPKSITLKLAEGEKWEVDGTYDIKWESTGYASDEKVKIKLLDERYDESSDAYELGVTETTNSGSCGWTIPTLLEGKELYGSLYRIAVYIGEGENEKSDISGSYLKINKPMFPYINVIYPDGHEFLTIGKSYTIKWDSLGWENYNVKISLKRDNIVRLVIADNIPNNGYYDWEVPGIVQGARYKVTIDIYDFTGYLLATNSSDNYFTITNY